MAVHAMGIRFGPSGNSKSFYDAGYTSTTQAPLWLYEMGLDAFEYSFGKGVRITEPSAAGIGKAMAEYGLALSIHAPYYINLGTAEAEKAANNLRYIIQTAQAASWMGAGRVILHPGSCTGQERDAVIRTVHGRVREMLTLLSDEGFGALTICPETMGKGSQIGSLDEIMRICEIDAALVPCIDFGHLHARGLGALNTEEDFSDVLDTIERELGKERLDKIHIHFSRIEFTGAGEKKHWDLKDVQYGPEFSLLARQLKSRQMSPIVISESQNDMAEDALAMKKIYLQV
jgi:deoxyribonuclease IV